MKKIINILSVLFVFVALITSCEDRTSGYEFPKDQYFYDIPDVPVTENYVIGVPYDVKMRDSASQMWWDNSKKAHSLFTGHPALGEYDVKADPDVLRQHLEWGKEAGIDFFVLSWGGHGYIDTLLWKYEDLWKQDHAYPRIAIRFDPGYLFNRPKYNDSIPGKSPITGKDTIFTIAHTDTLMLNAGRMDTLRLDMNFVYDQFLSHDFAYKNNGRAMMILCNFSDKGSKITSLKTFVDYLKTPHNLWMIGELPSNWSSPENWGWRDASTHGVVKPDTIGTLDAMYITDLQTNNYDRYQGLYSFLDFNYNYWQERMLPMGKEYIPTIFPAFDDKIREPLSNQYFYTRWKENEPVGKQAYVVSSIQEDGTGTYYNFSNITKNPYQQFANVAKRNAGPSRIIFVRNWNNYDNGNTLEPTVEYGTDYLRYTKQFFKK